ncbi:MAG: prepilin-type N-terminal cleavage/methylation domain-containing protein [Methylococcales bacterium]|jgi:general secretion pathway protein J|nr:prepilin-type N-terminal cleavage/methylation domain-containing protein [Methylococcales bacterium]MBT7443866.1 prepilin-type N-terminal cleavage/methylation domain-containing protein [Methylococcales bacterium]
MKQSGFTLLEVLIAMTLLGLLMVMLYQTLNLGSSSWNASEKRIAQVSKMRDAYRFIRKQIQRIKPTGDFQGPEEERKFVGREKRLTFVSNVPDNVGLSGPALHTLEVEDGAEGLQLRLKMALDHPDSEWVLTSVTDSDEEGYVLIAGASHIQFSYFGARNLGNKPEWFDQWEGENVPSLIRLKVDFESSVIAWPDLLVALQADTNVQPIVPGQRGGSLGGGGGNVPINIPGQ